MNLSKFILLVVFAGLTTVFACAPLQGGQQMRVVNASPNAITNLHVLFPDQDIAFGDVAANGTTDYKLFPKGVYGYAAYRYDLNGETITQPVIDWVGETPMEGNSFTYTIAFNPDNPNMMRIELVNVTRDQ